MKKKVTNNGGVTAIYVRRSVADRDNNSLSIESQKEDCIRYVGEDCVYRLYCDNGFSGKDTEHRPAFQQMMSDAREGLISRIVVKKYDRFSRNLRDYLNVSEELDKLGVTVYSLSEPFNTETKEGRMMRNNLLNFAEFERETIAGRVADAYDTRGRETGFYQGGTMSFGYTTQRMTVVLHIRCMQSRQLRSVIFSHILRSMRTRSAISAPMNTAVRMAVTAEN